jgi:pyruvate dehydrogenase E2 component (dihydrolipoamide acetyltransferase)
MATDVIMPALGVAQEKGTLLNWFKTEGQSVTKGERLMEIETDKATVEIEAPASGILANVTVSPGDQVPVGNRIAVILAPGEALPTEREATPAEVHPPPLPQVEKTSDDGPAISTPTLPAEPATQTRRAGERVLASPAARRIAREKGIDLSALHGSGPEGAVLAEDVIRSTAALALTPKGLPTIRETVELSPMRRIVGERMTKSKQTAPHFYLSMDVDMTEVMRRRNLAKEKGEQPVSSINDFILFACARALREFPSLNAAFTDQGVHLYSDIHLGVAVALEEGLVVPVIRNADRLSVEAIAKQSRELAEKAQKKKLFPLDYEGSTFTVSNLGMFGVDNFVAIINPPQCAILAVGRVAPRVVADGENVAIRSLMSMTLSADHRIVDGAIGAKFLEAVKLILEAGKF